MIKKVLTVLLIEDSPEFAELVQRWLVPQGDIDLTLNWSDSLANGLDRLATRVVIEHSLSMALVVKRDPACVRIAGTMLRAIESWNATPYPVGAVIVSRASVSCPMPLPEIDSLLVCEVLRVVPPAADMCLRAQNAGVPLVAVDSESPISRGGAIRVAVRGSAMTDFRLRRGSVRDTQTGRHREKTKWTLRPGPEKVHNFEIARQKMSLGSKSC
jgi:CheY-like chemotaxis protein